MTYCINCGTSLNENAVTCPKCGQGQKNIPVSLHKGVTPDQLQPSQQSQPQGPGQIQPTGSGPSQEPGPNQGQPLSPVPGSSYPGQPTYIGNQGTYPGGAQGQFQGPAPNQSFSQGQPQGPYGGASPGQQLFPGPASGSYQGTQPGWPPYGQAPLLPDQSPKSKTATLLLCWFFGWLGVHRFYVGRVVTGILMLLTLGGLGIWTLIDFIIAATGKLRDGQGKLINKPANVGLVVGLIIGISVIGLVIISIFAAITIPQYQKYVDSAKEVVALTVLTDIRSSEDKYYIDNITYTDSYEELAKKTTLTKDSNINYGPIYITNDGNSYSFSISHKDSSTLYIYDSAYDNIHPITTKKNEGLTSSSW